jgi:hypothetical protein
MNACVKRRTPESERLALEFEAAILDSVHFRCKEQSVLTDIGHYEKVGSWTGEP